MLDTPCFEVVWRVLATHSIRQFPLHFPSRVPSHFNWSLMHTAYSMLIRRWLVRFAVSAYGNVCGSLFILYVGYLCPILMEIETILHFFTMFMFMKSRWISFSDYIVFTCLRSEGHNDCNRYIAGMRKKIKSSYVYWTVHHLDSWVKRDQLGATCFIITLFSAQHISDVNTSILRSLRLIRWVTSWVVLLWFDVCWCYVVVWLWWCGIRMQASARICIPNHPSQTTT